MNAKLLLFSCLMMGTLCNPKNDLTCTICVDIVTDIDNFITSETTEQQIVEFVEEVSRKLEIGADMKEYVRHFLTLLVFLLQIKFTHPGQSNTKCLFQICLSLGSLLPPDLHLDIFCTNLVDEQLPGIIDGLVEQNLNPEEVCAYGPTASSFYGI